MQQAPDKRFLFDYYNSQDEDHHRMYGGGGFREHKQRRRLQLIAEALAPLDLRGKSVLDLGCGDSHAASMVLRGNGFRYIGLDLSRRKLAEVRTAFAGSAAILADAENIPLAERSIDCVLCFETFEHLPQPQDAVREVARVLKDDGVAIVSVPINAGLQPFLRWCVKTVKRNGAFDEHLQTFTERGLLGLLARNGLTPVAWETCGFNVPGVVALLDRLDDAAFERLDGALSRLPLNYLGFGIHSGVSLAVGNEYIIVTAKRSA